MDESTNLQTDSQALQCLKSPCCHLCWHPAAAIDRVQGWTLPDELGLAAGKTLEVRRSEEKDAGKRVQSQQQLQASFLPLAEDRHRPRLGLPPLPKAVPPPAPVTRWVRTVPSRVTGHGCQVWSGQWHSLHAVSGCAAICMALVACKQASGAGGAGSALRRFWQIRG